MRAVVVLAIGALVLSSAVHGAEVRLFAGVTKEGADEFTSEETISLGIVGDQPTFPADPVEPWFAWDPVGLGAVSVFTGDDLASWVTPQTWTVPATTQLRDAFHYDGRIQTHLNWPWQGESTATFPWAVYHDPFNDEVLNAHRRDVEEQIYGEAIYALEGNVAVSGFSLTAVEFVVWWDGFSVWRTAYLVGDGVIIPEPASSWLLTIALAALAARPRQRRE